MRVFLAEFVNTTRCIDQLLFTGEEGMALRTDFNGDITDGRMGLKFIAARAANSAEFILRVNSFFHYFLLGRQ